MKNWPFLLAFIVVIFISWALFNATKTEEKTGAGLENYGYAQTEEYEDKIIFHFANHADITITAEEYASDTEFYKEYMADILNVDNRKLVVFFNTSTNKFNLENGFAEINNTLK